VASERQNEKEGRAEQSHPGDRQPRRFALRLPAADVRRYAKKDDMKKIKKKTKKSN
jgi:predicted nucleic acid-binding Zn ribbon protein